MRHHSPWLRCLGALLLVVPLLGTPSGAAPFDSSAQTDQSLSSLLNEGAGLENTQAWAKALEVYEQGLERWPHDRVLEQRRDQCKIHLQIARRYSDESFRTSLLRLPREQAIRLYNETLLMLQTHYVDPLVLGKLVNQGTENLKVAVADPEFVRANLPGRSPQEIRRFTDALSRQVVAYGISDRRDAHEAVQLACDLGRSMLGLADAAVVMEYVYGACESLDPHSSYLTPDQLTDLHAQIDGNFVGLGVELKKDSDDLVIVRVLPDSPAIEGGLRSGDVIVAIGGQPTAPLNLDQAANRLGGTEGSLVTLHIRSGANSLSRTLTLRRRAVDVKSITQSRIVDRAYGIAYIQLTAFQKTTTAELNAALWDLHRQGMRFLILDLRGNPGGLLTSAVEVSDRFVSHGTIVSTRGRSPGESWAYSAHEAGTWGVPLALLVDEDSASASEIVAACIRDTHRGKLVGRKTYGKGSVQTIHELRSVAGGLRLTTAKFFSPTGQALDHVGVQPDILIQRSSYRGADQPAGRQESDPSADPEMNAALRVARQELAQRTPAVSTSRSSFESRIRARSR